EDVRVAVCWPTRSMPWGHISPERGSFLRKPAGETPPGSTPVSGGQSASNPPRRRPPPILLAISKKPAGRARGRESRAAATSERMRRVHNSLDARTRRDVKRREWNEGRSQASTHYDRRGCYVAAGYARKSPPRTV